VPNSWLPKKELIGMNNRQYTEKDVAKKVFKAFNGVYKTVSPSNISIGRSSEKTELKDTLKHLYRYEKITLVNYRFRGIIRDITERKQRRRISVKARRISDHPRRY